MAVRTAKQKAALRKAQLASAKKRKRSALVRNTGRGLVGKKNGSRKTRYKVARAAGAVAAGVAVAYAGHKFASHDYHIRTHSGKDPGHSKKRVLHGNVTHKGNLGKINDFHGYGGSVRVGKKRYGGHVAIRKSHGRGARVYRKRH